MKNVVVTGDEVGVGMVGHRELLHGTCLDQLLRESKTGPMHQGGQGTPPVKGSYCTQTQELQRLCKPHPCPRPPRQGAIPQPLLQLYTAGAVTERSLTSKLPHTSVGTQTHYSGKGHGRKAKLIH